MEIEYTEGGHKASFIDAAGDALHVFTCGPDLVIDPRDSWRCYGRTCAIIDAEQVEELIALLQRWRETGQLRPEGEGA